MHGKVGTFFVAVVLVALIFGPVGQAMALNEDVPKPLQPGSSFTAPASSPTPYWILTDSNMRELEMLKRDNEVLTESRDLLKKQVEIEREARKTREGQLSELQGGYEHYRQLYMGSLNELENTKTELAREKAARRTMRAISFGIALLAGAGGVALGYTIAH